MRIVALFASANTKRGRFCVFLQANDPQQGLRFKDLLFVFAIAVSSLVPYITNVFEDSCPHDSRRRDGIALLSLGLYGFCKSAQNASALSGVAFVAWRNSRKAALFPKNNTIPVKSDCLLQKHRRFCHTSSCDASLTLTGATVYRRFLSCVRMAQRCRKLEDKQQNPVSRTPSKTVTLCARSNGRPVLCMHAAFCKAPP